MSFSARTKAELCEIEPKKDCCLRAECYGAWLFSRSFTLLDAAFTTESAPAARRMLELAGAAAGVSGELTYAFSRRKKPSYRVTLPDASARRQLLETFGHTGWESSLGINRAVLENDCCTASFLRGAFLSCGAATDPQKDYRLEFSVPYQKLANGLYTLLREVEVFSAQPLLASRRGGYAVYWKDGGQIEDFLTWIGAPKAAMELMQVRMYKEARNDINRKANFETANMDKTYSASARQIAAIAAISDGMGLGALPEELSELARLRLEHPDMTLRELSAALGISRSGANHRMQRLLELGEKLLKDQISE